MLAASTHAAVGGFVISNWTDLYCVDPGIKVNIKYYPDILLS